MNDSTHGLGTLGEYACGQLARVARALDFNEEDSGRLSSVFGAMSASWNEWPRDRVPRWSGFSDDCSPYEISVVYGGSRPEVRFALETQDRSPSIFSYWRAGLELNRRLERDFGANLQAFHQVEDLFRPTAAGALLAMWHAACVWPGEEPAFKLYLNPFAQGHARATCAVGEALERLGFPWAKAALASVTRPEDKFVGFGVDLSASLGGRAKVYVRLPNPTTDDVERYLGLAAESETGDARAFIETLTEGRRLASRPVLVVYSFREDSQIGERPARAAILLSPGAYARTDAEIRARVRALLQASEIAPDAYDRTAMAFDPADPRNERRAHGYISWQRESGRPRVTAYFYARAFRDQFGEVDPVSSPWPSPHRRFAAS